MNEKYLEMAVKKTPMITLGRYRPEIGKYKGRRLDEIPLLHLKKYHGDWEYTISTQKADGNYNLSINTY